MTRIEGKSKREAGPLVRLIYRLSRRELGRDVDPVAVYAHAPQLLIGYGAFEKATARQQRVEERLKVLAETKAAAVVNCEFCCDIASSIARDAGVTEQQLLALPSYRDSEEFSELERLVLDYATAMSRSPTTVDDTLFAALREHFDERQMVELTNVIALENMRARFNSAFDMTPAGFSEGLVCAVPEVAGEPAQRDAPASPVAAA
ncbi:MAG TPA: carboxymuconolactone decarboxylase family protein [Solirubrobacteraceae bacterium]|nr:carboxymuconolactone decarboxylase family protein [Solirubrobacteraceae bacterium]